MGYIILWFLFAIFSAIIASNKGRSVVGWFLVGFVFGPFGLVVGFLSALNEKVSDNTGKQSRISNSGLLDTDSYYYEIKPSSDSEEWQNIKQVIFDYLGTNYKLKQNDKEMVFFEVTKESYIKIFKTLREHRPYFAIESNRCGKLNFEENFDVAISEKTFSENTKIDEKSNMDSAEKLIKLAELKEKGLITDDEFTAQKSKLI